MRSSELVVMVQPRMCVHTYVCVWTRTCVCVCVHMSVCVYVCLYTVYVCVPITRLCVHSVLHVCTYVFTSNARNARKVVTISLSGYANISCHSSSSHNQWPCEAISYQCDICQQPLSGVVTG